MFTVYLCVFCSKRVINLETTFCCQATVTYFLSILFARLLTQLQSLDWQCLSIRLSTFSFKILVQAMKKSTNLKLCLKATSNKFY